MIPAADTYGAGPSESGIEGLAGVGDGALAKVRTETVRRVGHRSIPLFASPRHDGAPC